MNEKDDAAPTRIPVMWVASAVILTLVMFGLLVWQAVNTFQVSPAVHEAYLRGEKFRDELSRLHREQMLSLAMMVGTGSSSWEQNYDELERELYSAIQSALNEKPPGFDLEALARLQAAHDLIRERAARGIELARAGREQEGLGMLSARKFKRARGLFLQEMDGFIADYGAFLRERLRAERQERILALVLAFLIFSVCLTVWVLLLRRTSRSQRDRALAIEASSNAEAELRKLARQLHSMEEHQCNVIAREVHDEMGQSLTALKIDLVRLRKALAGTSGGDIQALLEGLLQETNEAIDSVQRLVSSLRPAILDHLGFAETMRWQVNELHERTGIRFQLTLGSDDPDLSREEKIALFRIVQESLTNVVRHSEATAVRIEFATCEAWEELTIADNGRGMPESELENPSSYGLQGMRERARFFGGELDITSLPAKGTTVRVRIPARRRATEPSAGTS